MFPHRYLKLGVLTLGVLVYAPRSVAAQTPLEVIKQKLDEAKKKNEQGKPQQPASSKGSEQTAAAMSSQAAKIEEQVLLAGEAGAQFEISPAGQHVAAVVMRGSRQVVIYDGVEGPKFDDIYKESGGAVAFSDDGKRWAYIARQGNDWVAMVDGKELVRGTPYPTAGSNGRITGLGFSPGGKHVYFRAGVYDSQRPEYRVYVDGQPGPASVDEINEPLWSENGERHAYGITIRDATRNLRRLLILDGKVSPITGGDLQFTADGSHVFTAAQVPNSNAREFSVDGKPFMRASHGRLYMAPAGNVFLGAMVTEDANRRQTSFLTVGNKKIPGSECGGTIMNISFSKDGKYFAARCQESSSSHWLFANGKRGQTYTSIDDEVQFTADGRPVYAAMMNGKYFLIVGDEESNGFSYVAGREPTADDRSQRWALVNGNHVAFFGRTNSPDVVVTVDGKATSGRSAAGFHFSPDGSRYAYSVDIGGSRQIVVDGVQQKGDFGAIRDQGQPFPRIVFSADNKHVAYAAQNKANQYGVVIDGRFFTTPAIAGQPFNLMFTPDGKHLIFAAWGAAASRRVLYVDGQPVREMDQNAEWSNMPGVMWSIGADGVLTVLGQENGALKRLRITPGPGSVDAMLAKAR